VDTLFDCEFFELRVRYWGVCWVVSRRAERSGRTMHTALSEGWSPKVHFLPCPNFEDGRVRRARGRSLCQRPDMIERRRRGAQPCNSINTPPSAILRKKKKKGLRTVWGCVFRAGSASSTGRKKKNKNL